MSESVPMLALRLRDSRCLRFIRVGVHAVAVGAVMFVPASLALGAVAAAVLLIVCGWCLRRQRAPLRLVQLGTDGRCGGVDESGAVTEGTLGAGSLAVPGLIVLEIRAASGRRLLAWLPDDAFEGDGQRRLRVRVRLAA